jgi:ribosomal protein S18 acetylase RimI-like enzyme
MDMIARLAVPGDAAELVRLRALMFESMGFDVSGSRWRSTCLAHLEEGLADGRFLGAVVDAPDGSGLACSGLAEVSKRIPSPGNPSGAAAYLSSFSTDPRWRRRGMARRVLQLLLDRLRENDVRRIELHATDDGLPLYRCFGFVDRQGGTEMRLDLPI